MRTRRQLAIGVLASLVFSAGCGGRAAMPSPEESALRDCGVEESRHGENLNVAGRQCLLDAFVSGTPAVFVANALTVEGAPIVTTYRVLGSGAVRVEHDARRDPLGSGRIEILHCPRLVPVAEWNAVSGHAMGDDYVFVEDGCQPT